jgi:NADH-quinone oxidoreductase subunit N
VVAMGSESMNFSSFPINPLMPEFTLGVLLVSVIFAELTYFRSRKRLLNWITFFGFLTASVQVWIVFAFGEFPASSELTHPDGFSTLGRTLVYLFFALQFLFLLIERDEEQKDSMEKTALHIIAGIGAGVLCLSNHYFFSVLGISLYFVSVRLVGALEKNSAVALEAAIKGFRHHLFGVLLLVFGGLGLYSLSGSLEFLSIRDSLSSAGPSASVSIGFVLLGLMSLSGIFPFHFWTPDTTQGIKTSNLGIISAVSQILPVLFAARFLSTVLPEKNFFEESHVFWPFAILLILGTIFTGSLTTGQPLLKRALGWLLSFETTFLWTLLFCLTQEKSLPVLFYYFFISSCAIAGVFWSLALLEKSYTIEKVGDLAGIKSTHTLTLFSFLFFVGTYIGVPPFPGIANKLLSLTLVQDAGFRVLLIAISTVLFTGALFFFKILGAAMKDEPTKMAVASPRLRGSPLFLMALALILAASFVFSQSILNLFARVLNS